MIFRIYNGIKKHNHNKTENLVKKWSKHKYFLKDEKQMAKGYRKNTSDMGNALKTTRRLPLTSDRTAITQNFKQKNAGEIVREEVPKPCIVRM